MEIKDLNLDQYTALASDTPPTPTPPELTARRFAFLTAEGQTATPLEQEALLGTNDLVEVSFLERCLLVRDCIGRIHIRGPNRRGWATGFLIAPGLLMTNYHVFPTAADAAESRIEFGYWYDVAGQLPKVTQQFGLEPDRFFVSDKALDFAVVAVRQLSETGQDIADRSYLRLIPLTGKVKKGEFVTIMQHPDGDAMCIALRENEVTRTEDTEPVICYQADTAHGSSGAPVLNDSFQLVALHSSGRIRRNDAGLYARADGSWTSTLDGLGEADVIWDTNVGIRISRIVPSLLDAARAQWPGQVAAIEAALAGGDVLARKVADRKKQTGPDVAPPQALAPQEEEIMTERNGPGTPAANIGAGSGIVVPLQLRISLEAGGTAVVAQPARMAATTGLETEAFELRSPVIYDGLEDRPGFQPDFLELADLPMPEVSPAGRKILAPLLDGSGFELKYQHFSVWMQKERRLALFTASNVDWRARKQKVGGKSTSRDSLAGFPPKSNFAELWVDEPRIDARHQLPDVFYSQDRGAFDKGHIVRRDDVCWGSTFEEIQMANGDTFHVTNCSPQIKPFNQGAAGQENWGDLESYIQQATKKDAEKACIFAGPIFGADDRWFHGKDDNGAARVQVPSSFWKIVVVAEEGEFKAYGFVLSQDIRPITEEEFFVTEEWRGALKPISEIAGRLRGWLNLDALTACDQYAAVMNT